VARGQGPKSFLDNVYQGGQRRFGEQGESTRAATSPTPSKCRLPPAGWPQTGGIPVFNPLNTALFPPISPIQECEMCGSAVSRTGVRKVAGWTEESVGTVRRGWER